MYYYRGYLKCIKRNKSKGREGWCRDRHTVIILCHRKCQPRNWVLSKARRKTMTKPCVSWGKTFPPLEKTAVALLYRKHRNLAVLTHFILLNPSTGNISFLRKKNWDLGRLRSFFFLQAPLNAEFKPRKKLQSLPWDWRGRGNWAVLVSRNIPTCWNC